MWQAYIDFLDWMMHEEDPEDPFSYRSCTPEELAEASVFLLLFSLVMWAWGVHTYGY